MKNREEPNDAISWRYENLDYALQHIKGCFGSGIETHINRKDAYIFANFAQQEVEALKENAEEIDERYSQQRYSTLLDFPYQLNEETLHVWQK